MPEQELNRAQVGARLEEMDSERMAERVWRYRLGHARAAGGDVAGAPDRPRSDWCFRALAGKEPVPRPVDVPPSAQTPSGKGQALTARASKSAMRSSGRTGNRPRVAEVAKQALLKQVWVELEPIRRVHEGRRRRRGSSELTRGFRFRGGRAVACCGCRGRVATGRPACQRATRVLRWAPVLRMTRRPSLRSESSYGPCGPAWTGASRPSTTSRRAREE